MPVVMMSGAAHRNRRTRRKSAHSTFSKAGRFAKLLSTIARALKARGAGAAHFAGRSVRAGTATERALEQLIAGGGRS
jgi:hypothetical protein